MKKKIIFLHFNRFLEIFDWKRYELDKLSKKYVVEVHVMVNIVHPHLNKKFIKKHKHDIKIFQNYSQWKKKIKKEGNNCHFIFQSFPYNFTALKIYHFIKKKNFKTSIIFINNLPKYKHFKNKKSIIENLIKKILSFKARPKQSIIIIKKNIIILLFKIFSSRLGQNFSIVGGPPNLISSFRNPIKINSWDYSYSLRKNEKIKINGNYILYLSDGETRYQSDSTIWNTKRIENTKTYLKKLRKFFDKIEEKYKTKIVIAGHPRGNPDVKKDIKLGNRKNFYGKTYELTKKAKFVITIGSTALSYAILLRKPILFIYSSSEQEKNISGNKFLKFFSEMLNCNRIDLDKFDINQKNLIKTVNSNSYKNYETNYIKSQKKIPNYRIISNIIDNC